MKNAKLRMTSVSVRGQHHSADNSPCQDAVCEERSSHISGVCVSDGAGSCRASHIGAGIVTKWAARHISRAFSDLYEAPEAGSSELLYGLRRELNDEAAALGCRTSELSCTLLFAFAEVRRNSVRYICGNLGDGAVIMQRSGTAELLLHAENGEYANQTWFVTSPDAASHFRVCTGSCSSDSLPGWLLATDGAWPFLYSRSQGKVAPAAGALLEDVRTATPRRSRIALRSFLERRIVPRTGDDCSIGLLQTDARGHRVSRRPVI